MTTINISVIIIAISYASYYFFLQKKSIFEKIIDIFYKKNKKFYPDIMPDIFKAVYLLNKNKKKKLIFCCLVCTFLLTGCSSIPTDKELVNYYDETQTYNSELTDINLYIDSSSSMPGYIDTKEFSPIIYSLYSTLNDISIQKNITFNINKISDEKIEQSDSSEFSEMLENKELYNGSNKNVVETVFNSHAEGALSVVVTNLNGQLKDYSGIARAIIDNALAKENAVALVGIKTSGKPIFVIAAGSNFAISEMISKFKEKPDVIEYYGKQELLQLDVTKNINYEIFADNNGIMGINYKDISVVENGEIYDVVRTENEDGSVDIQTNVIYEMEGSFTDKNDNYTKDMLNTIEGTVNFADISKDTKRIVKNAPDKYIEETNEEGKKVKTPINKENIVYIAARSLVKNREETLAGKLKLEIPFNVIDGVKLSDLECDVTSELYITDGNQFRKYNDNIDEFVNVGLAEGAIEEQGKWRVINERNSVICNLLFENAANFPKTNGMYKLNINFKQYLDKEKMPSWIAEWSKNDVSNLENLVSSLYEYQANKNASENQMTIYIAEAKK